MVHTDVNGEDKTYTVIKGWKADTSEGVKKLAKNLASDTDVENIRNFSGQEILGFVGGRFATLDLFVDLLCRL